MIINEKSQTDLSGFYIVYKGSVLNEDDTNYGISHLMEHLMCKQFQKYYNEFERYSINWNAYTSGNEVVFHMKGLDEYLYKYRHLLVDSLLKFKISRDEFEKERDVVVQEYKDTFQDQSSSAYYNLLRKTYKNYGPIGKLECLEKLTYEDINNYWKKYLSKPSMIINISKNSVFDGFNEFNTTHPRKYTPKSNDVLTYEKILKFKKDCVFGYIKINDDFNYVDFILDMLNKSLESPFMKEIREKRGLTYGVSSYICKLSDSEGLVTTSLITTEENVDECLDTYKMILTQPDKYLTKERFDIIKDFYTVKKKKDEINLYTQSSKFITPKNWQIEEILDVITFEKVLEIYDNYLTFDKWKWETDKNAF